MAQPPPSPREGCELWQWTPHMQKSNSSLAKNYCITISIQKIGSIYKFTLKIQQILGSHELKGLGHFLIMLTQKSLNQLLAFLICTSMQKISYSISSFFRYSKLQSFATRMITPNFVHAHPKIFQSPFNLHEYVTVCKKIS